MPQTAPIIIVSGLACLAPNTALAQTSTSAGPVDCAEQAIRRQVDRAGAVLRDWPNLARFRDANATLAPPSKGERRVVFMGDSITDNWDNDGFGGFFRGQPYVNRGISGQTTPQMLLRFRADVIALKPQAVVILGGTNDLAGNTGPTTLSAIEDNLASMAELARVHAVRVVLASILPANDTGHDHEGRPLTRTRCRPPELVVALNDWMRDYAARRGHVYLDYHAALVDDRGRLREDLSDDGLHPNAKAYAAMAPLAEKAIAAALGLTPARRKK